MAAVVRASYASGAGPTLATAEGGATYNREESLAGLTTPVPKPNATGTAFSWPKIFCLEVTTPDTTSISNRRHRIASAPAAGLKHWFIDNADTYTQVAALAAADSGTNDSTPAGYGATPTSDTVYDAGVDVANSGRSGDYLRYAVGLSNLYLGGAGSAIALPNAVLTYDEA